MDFQKKSHDVTRENFCKGLSHERAYGSSTDLMNNKVCTLLEDYRHTFSKCFDEDMAGEYSEKNLGKQRALCLLPIIEPHRYKHTIYIIE